MERGLVTLLYKKGLREELKNWRLITLLNFDSKLLAKVLAERFKSILGALIHKDQPCGMLGCQIHRALVQLRDALQLERERRQSVAVLNLDLEKTYDRTSHQFLFQTLEQMGVPPDFRWLDQDPLHRSEQ
ncbi:hypothetical protein Y1Q_0016843 [Alligator mississippiensis]|uniref:Reverse transcriptase domain-containing protein n=1 Tax=Alligator mississippiensis TaxID=8496 RepID=A0A151P752_ALLMI|nr:hypothetical protein Y1Q_0016843 [Alligator mississippiensis]